MFGKTEFGPIKDYDSTISSKVNIDGNIYTESSLYIAAKINGEIRSDSDVYIDADGIVNGNIFARNICISGVVEGSVEASGALKIQSTGKLYGDINVFRFIASEGAVFEGKCTMNDLTSARAAPPLIRNVQSSGGMFRKKDYLDDIPAMQIAESKNDKT